MVHLIKAFGPLSVCNHMRLLGFDAEPALKLAGLELAEIHRPGCKIPSASLYDLVEAASRVTGRPDFGLSWGAHTGFRRFGPLATYLANCDSIRQTVTGSATYLARHNYGIKCQVVELGDISRVEFELIPKGRLSSYQYLESLMVAQLPLWKMMLGDAWAPVEVWFHHQAQAPHETYTQVFGCRVRFGMHANAFVARTSDMDRRETQADPKVRAVVEAMLAEELRCVDLSFFDDVRSALRTLIPSNEVTLHALSKLLRMDPAALAIRFADSNQSLKSMVTEARLETIAFHAGCADITLPALMQNLGFRDAAGMNRFVRQNARRISAKALEALAQHAARH